MVFPQFFWNTLTHEPCHDFRGSCNVMQNPLTSFIGFTNHSTSEVYEELTSMRGCSLYSNDS